MTRRETVLVPNSDNQPACAVPLSRNKELNRGRLARFFERLALQSRTKLRGGCAHFQKLRRAIAHHNLKSALCFFFGASLQCKLANKKVGLAEALSAFLRV